MQSAKQLLSTNLARLRGEKLDDLDVEALGVLLSTLDAARTKVEAARQRKIENRVPDDYVCAISQEIMVDPCVWADGHSYERTAIAAWLETHDTSPQTNLPLEHKYLVPNITLKKAIAQFQSRTQLEEVSVRAGPTLRRRRRRLLHLPHGSGGHRGRTQVGQLSKNSIY